MDEQQVQEQTQTRHEPIGGRTRPEFGAPLSDHSSSTDVSVPAVVGAVIGAGFGALIWAAVAYFTGYEIGWIAWGIGLFAGIGAVQLGGRGATMGVVCAVLALAGIFAGKMLATHFLVDDELSSVLTRDLYQEYSTDATAYAALGAMPDDETTREFMISHGYTEAYETSQVHPDEITWFNTEQVPMLRRMAASPPSFEEWQEQVGAEVLGTDFSVASVVVDELSAMDLVFALLGIITAFQVVNNRSKAQTA